jgi:hypothetical protein
VSQGEAADTPAVSSVSVGTELLVNGDFSMGNEKWDLGNYEGASAEAVATDGEMVLAISSPGAQNWNVQFQQSPITLEKGITYTMSFDAKASVARSIMANVGQGQDPYGSCSDALNADLTTEYQTL